MSEDRLKYLRPFLNFVPPKLEDECYSRPSASPITFYNRDLEMGLSLKRIVSLPTLLSVLLQVAEQALPVLEGCGLPARLDSSEVKPRNADPDVDVTTVEGIAKKYALAVGGPSSTIASLFIHRNTAEGWAGSAYLMERSVPPDHFSSSEYGVGMDDMDEGVSYEKYRSVLPEDMEHLKDLWKYTPNLMAFQFLRPSRTAADILKQIVPVRRFDWVSHSTKGLGFTSISPEELFDATGNLWSNAIDQHALHLRRSERLRGIPKSLPNTTRAARLRAGKPGNTDRAYAIKARDFVQQLWSHAVRRDVSWLVFHCGSHERIGFRHRETQTLYISDLITIPGNEDYSKIQLGLHLAAVNDSVRRAEFLKWLEQNPAPIPPVPTRQGKRKRKDNEASSSNPSKKRKLEDESLQRLENCDWMLVSSKYDKFDSPAPAFFVRCNLTNNDPMHIDIHDLKSSYPLKGSIELQLSQQIGSGAIGQVHGAQVISHKSSTDPVSMCTDKVVVKLAFSPRDYTRLLFEANIYERLKERNVQHVPRFFGCFRNIEGDALALVIERGGTSLGSMPKFRCMTEDPDGGVVETNAVSIPEPLQGKVKTALQSVHDADVLHRDIRKWNILIDNDDNVMIIDFDRAHVRNSASQKEREMDRLDRLLNGDFQDGIAGNGSSRSTYA